MSTIAKAYVQLVPSAKGMKGAIGQAMGGEMPAAGKAAGAQMGGSLIGKVKGLIATAGIGAAFGAAISEGAAMEQSLGGIETLFKDSADKVIANAKQAYKTAGMSANQYMELTTSFSASLLQSVAGDTSRAADISDMAMRDMSDNANKMGTDLERITDAYQGFAKGNYTMLDNLKLGYGGTKTEMQRLLADAQKISGVEYNIDNLSDVYEAIHVIQGELDITGTTAKEASETISGSAAGMKAAFKDLMANITLGKPIGDSMKALTESVFTFAKNLLPAVGNILGGLPDVLRAAFSAAIQGLNLAAENADSLVQQGLDLVLGIGGAIIEATPELLTAAVVLVQELGSALMASLEDSGGIVGTITESIDLHLPEVLDKGTEMLNSLVTGIFNALPGLVDSAAQSISTFASTIIDNLPQIIESGKSILLNVVEGIKNSLPSIISSAGTLISTLVTGIVDNLPQIIDSGFDLVTNLIKGIGDALPGIVEAAFDLIGKFWDAIKNTDWLQLGKDIINGLINGIGSMGSALWDAAKNVAKSALNGIKSFFGIHSPSTVMRDQVGKFLPAGIAVGIEANTKPVVDAMHDLSNLTTDSLTPVIPSGSLAVPQAAAAPTTVQINVYGAPGQDISRLADIVMARIQDATDRKGGVFA